MKKLEDYNKSADDRLQLENEIEDLVLQLTSKLDEWVALDLEQKNTAKELGMQVSRYTVHTMENYLISKFAKYIRYLNKPELSKTIRTNKGLEESDVLNKKKDKIK